MPRTRRLSFENVLVANEFRLVDEQGVRRGTLRWQSGTTCDELGLADAQGNVRAVVTWSPVAYGPTFEFFLNDGTRCGAFELTYAGPTCGYSEGTGQCYWKGPGQTSAQYVSAVHEEWGGISDMTYTAEELRINLPGYRPRSGFALVLERCAWPRLDLLDGQGVPRAVLVNDEDASWLDLVDEEGCLTLLLGLIEAKPLVEFCDEDGNSLGPGG